MGKAAEFLKKARVKDRDLYEKVEITPQQLEKWEKTSIQAIDLLTAFAKSSVSGFATASAAVGLVGAVGVASTGTAISTLSGAAATKATLAWLGGGAIAAGGGGIALGGIVLNSIFFGPALLVSSFFIGRKAEEIKTRVESEIAKMDVAEAQMRQHLTLLEEIVKRLDELIESTRKMDESLKDKLSTADPDNLEDAYAIAKIAKSLATLLDIRILDENGNLI